MEEEDEYNDENKENDSPQEEDSRRQDDSFPPEKEGVLSQPSGAVSRVKVLPHYRAIVFVLSGGSEAAENDKYEVLSREPSNSQDTMFWSISGHEVPVYGVRERDFIELFRADKRDNMLLLSSPCPKLQNFFYSLDLNLDSSGGSYPVSPEMSVIGTLDRNSKTSQRGLGALADSSRVRTVLDEANSCKAGRTDEDRDNTL